MLILKMNADLPISVRNLGHNVGMSVKRLETSLKSDIDLNQYPRLKSVSSEHLYNMQNIGRTILDLGNVETFEFERLFGRLKNLQADYSASAKSLLDSLVDALYEGDREAFNLIVPMALNEVDRVFDNEIQLSSVNRLEELQSLKDSTAISHIAGMLRADWSAKSFVEQYRSMFESKSGEIESNFREVFYQNCSILKLEEIDAEIERELKLSDDVLINFCEETVVPEVSAYLRGQYSELFVPNEDLSQLQANAEKVVSNCMLRGAAKKLILSFNDHLREEVAPQISDFLKKTIGRKLLEDVKSEAEEVLKEELEYCNHEFNEEDGDYILTVLPVSLKCDDFIIDHGDSSISIDRIYFGGTELDIKIDLKSKTAKVIKSEVEISEIEGYDINSGFGIEFVKDRSFEKEVLDSVETFIEALSNGLIESIESKL